MAEQPWRYPITFESQEVEVRFLNWEITRDKKNVLVHAKLRSNAKEPIYFDWQSVFTLTNKTGKKYSSNFDALVDRNGSGFTRTVNEFRLSPREKVQIMIPFMLGDEELPVTLTLPDGRESIKFP